MTNAILNSFSRRDIMRLGAKGAGASAVWLTLGGLGDVGLDQSGYKALVCVHLAGGNNGFNLVVPVSDEGYATYATTRSNLALPQRSLLTLNGTASDGYSYGLHPSCVQLRGLFNEGHLAVMGSVGTLVQPTSKDQVTSASVPLPQQLFSHLDQTTQWFTSIPDRQDRTGWAGRIADLYLSRGATPRLAMNLNIGGTNYWQEGAQTAPYAIGTGGAPSLTVINQGQRDGTRQDVARGLMADALTDRSLMVQQFSQIELSAENKVATVNSAFASITDIPVFPGSDGGGDLGAQLRQVARIIKAQAAIGDTRQIFFVQIGGFDTHNNELFAQRGLWSSIDTWLKAFWDALGTIGQQNNVTLFTTSDFGRTLGSNGDGSDHAWANHHLVLGGAVKGGFYGTMPNLTLNGPSDIGYGRVLPTTSTDQYAATLSRWFGVDESDLDFVLPNLRNFDQRDVGFFT